jgi:Zn-dependent M32 family carboxypeptidase
VLVAWDQEVCMPPSGAAARGDVRATIGRLTRGRFTDERFGELLEATRPRNDIAAAAVRVGRRDFDKVNRVPDGVAADIARTADAAPVARHEARQR